MKSPSPNPSAQKAGIKTHFFFLCGLILSAGTLLYLNNPERSDLFPPCPFHFLTGLYCPGCGSLRGLHQLMHGNLRAAFGLNPLMVSCLPFLGYSFFSYGMLVFRGTAEARFIAPGHIRALLAAVIAFGILRNIPVFPLTLLAP